MTNSSMWTADDWIDHLQMTPHPEGGHFKEIYRAPSVVQLEIGGQARERAAGTSIYYLLRRGEQSALHRLVGDEIWHYYAGAPMQLYTLDAADGLDACVIGPDAAAGHCFQAVIDGGVWFGGRPAPHPIHAYTLMGCTMGPGFDFDDFELASAEAVVTLGAEADRDRIRSLCAS